METQNDRDKAQFSVKEIGHKALERIFIPYRNIQNIYVTLICIKKRHKIYKKKIVGKDVFW